MFSLASQATWDTYRDNLIYREYLKGCAISSARQRSSLIPWRDEETVWEGRGPCQDSSQVCPG